MDKRKSRCKSKRNRILCILVICLIIMHSMLSLTAACAVDGHNEAVKEKVARFLEHLKLSPVILHEQVDGGRTIIEKFEANAENVDFAVVLLTADDKGKANNGKSYNSRARQNVIFEMGYFVGKLSRGHVFLLLEAGVEEPSDLEGIVYTSLSDNWKIKLFKELQDCGYKIDPNDLL